MTDDICIMEKGIPRDAGRLPEYAMSILVCIDEISNGIAWGHIWLFCMEKPIAFNGLGNLLLLIDLMLDKMGQPARWFELRTIMPGKMKDSECEDVYQTPVYTPEELKCMHGKIGTATVRIYARQNATIYIRRITIHGQGESSNQLSQRIRTSAYDAGVVGAEKH